MPPDASEKCEWTIKSCCGPFICGYDNGMRDSFQQKTREMYARYIDQVRDIGRPTLVVENRMGAAKKAAVKRKARRGASDFKEAATS